MSIARHDGADEPHAGTFHGWSTDAPPCSLGFAIGRPTNVSPRHAVIGPVPERDVIGPARERDEIGLARGRMAAARDDLDLWAGASADDEPARSAACRPDDRREP